MKTLHFCTPILTEMLREGIDLLTIRTGFIPHYFEGDLIKCYIPDTNFSRIYKVLSIIPVKYKNLGIPEDKIQMEEIAKYHKNFNPEQYFFSIHLIPEKKSL